MNPTAPVTPEAVARFLEEHPDFFAEHPDLLEQLALPHENGVAVSLVTRQIQLLRERNGQLRDKLHHLLQNARDNDRVFELCHRLSLSLMECQELGDLWDALLFSLQEEFKIPALAIWVLEPQLASATTQLWQPSPFQTSLNQRLATGKTAFSGLARNEINALFSEPGWLKSAALCVAYHGSRPICFIALGHPASDHYSPHKGTLFLRHLSELLSRMLGRFIAM